MSVERDYYKVVFGTDDRYKVIPARGIENGEWIEIHNNYIIVPGLKKYIKKEDLEINSISTTKIGAIELRRQQLKRNRRIVETQIKNGESFLLTKRGELEESKDRERALLALIDDLKDDVNT